jgi:hypothetical protein
MILNDKPNCQVSRILMNPRPILSDSSENDPTDIAIRTVNLRISSNHCVFKGININKKPFEVSTSMYLKLIY